MKFIADFHLHSKYSRATSPKMDLENLARWAKIKGIRVITTGDFTHPEWFKNLREKLRPAEDGLFQLKPGLVDSGGETRFILTTEISCIYSKKGRVRKIHILIFTPSLEAVEEINSHLAAIGNLGADGRPILGLDAKELAKIVLSLCPECLVVPAHMWTPWFSVFGSKSGFDSMEECFEDYARYIYAGETGLSSDPMMNWRLSALDRITLISNSDAHSLSHIGREANVFQTDLSYPSIVQAIKSKDRERFLYTIEFYPQEGKYHYDGHRSCGISLSPKETRRYRGICPRCGRPLTVGVLSRVEELADRPEGFVPEGAIPFKSLVPLAEIIAEAIGRGPGTMEVEKRYRGLVEKFENEFNILLDVPLQELRSATLPEIAEGIMRVRKGEVFIEPGYDGLYGRVRIFKEEEKRNSLNQGTLF